MGMFKFQLPIFDKEKKPVVHFMLEECLIMLERSFGFLISISGLELQQQGFYETHNFYDISNIYLI